MMITVASGKGGTGKTMVAVTLVLALAPERPMLVDCDVEEPNAALFLQRSIEERREVGQLTPQIDPQRCTGCGRCAEVCQYHALAVVNGKVLVFHELCHGCGSCAFVGRKGPSPSSCAPWAWWSGGAAGTFRSRTAS